MRGELHEPPFAREHALRREERGSIYRVLREAVPDFRKEAV